MKIAVIYFTSQGRDIANKLSEAISIDKFSKYDLEDFNLNKVTEKVMKNYQGIIFIGATGIAVRAIAPYILSKDKDPAVVVVDNGARYAISLLSGHLGGANELCLEVSKILEAEPIITTATDNLGLEAPDVIAKNFNLVIEDLKKAKDIASLLVEGKKVAFIDEENLISKPKGYVEGLKEAEGIVVVSNKLISEHTKAALKSLKLIRRNIVLGIGCRKNYEEKLMREKIMKTLEEYNIDLRAVKSIATVEVKEHEKAILSLKEELNCSMNIFTIEDIKKVEYKYKGSDFVQKTIGVRAVCEPCVELSGAETLTEKLSLEGMTLCIGQIKEG